MRACVRALVRDIPQNNMENEFYQHSNESIGGPKQASKHASMQACKQASKYASRKVSKQAST